MEERFWPFPIARPEAEWNEFDRDFVDFMRAADAEGYRPRGTGQLHYGRGLGGGAVGEPRVPGLTE